MAKGLSLVIAFFTFILMFTIIVALTYIHLAGIGHDKAVNETKVNSDPKFVTSVQDQSSRP